MSAASALASTLRRSTWPAGAVLALAIMLAAFALVKIVWLLLAGPTLPQMASESVNLPVQAMPRGSVSQWHLFGNAQAPAVEARLMAAKETTLKLTLRGTLNESAPDGGLAIVADEAGVDASYRVGDTLPGGGLLTEIHQGRVLFLREGVAETLSLPRDPAGVAAASGRAMPGATVSRPKAPALPGMAVGDMGQIGKIGPISPNIAPGLPSFESLRAATGVDPAQLAKQVQVFPVFANGRMRGVRLAAGRDSNLLESTGLKPTDLITSVNGIPLDGPARQSQLVASLGQGRVEVELERDGKPMKLVIGL